MKRRLSFIFMSILIVALIGYLGVRFNASIRTVLNHNQLTQKQKLDDFEYMYRILKENYPYFEVNKRQNGVDWLSNKDKYISDIKATSNDESFFKVLKNILAELNNGHTSIFNKDFYLLMKSLYEQDTSMSQAWIKQLNDEKAKERYSAMLDSKTIPQDSNYIFPDNVKTSILEKDKTAYMAIHSFNSFNITGDMKLIAPFLQSIKNYKALIIDIRGNGGGDSRYWLENIVPILLNKPLNDTQYVAFRGGSFTEQFIRNRFGVGYQNLPKISDIDNGVLKNLPPELKKDFKYYVTNSMAYEPINSIGFNGKIYLLVDSRVFSSAEAFAVFAKSTGFATLIGEKTGGDGIGFDPAVCTLPNSGYVFRFPLEMGLTSDGTSNFEHKTEPDIKVSAKVGAAPSEDEAVKTVLKLVE
jgi:C-terminal processing protease CtpA/Prc